MQMPKRRFRVEALFATLLAFAALLPGNASAGFGLPCSFSEITDGASVAFSRLLPRPAPAPPVGTLTVSPTYLPYAYNGDPYAATFSATGGTAPYTFAVTTGSLPPGMTLDTDGQLTGTSYVDDDFDFTITATDTYGVTGSRAYTLGVGTSILITISPSALPDGTVDEPYNRSFTASGGNPPYTFECYGDLPDGLELDANGTLSGTPTEEGTFNFTIYATDSVEFSGNRDYTLVINAISIELTPASLDDGTVGTAYSADLDASGGTPPYFFFVDGGELPPGLQLDDGTGAITGIPEVAGNYIFTVTAMDATEQQGSETYSVGILEATVVLDPTTLPDATVGTAYEVPVSASGGTEPYSFAITAGTLPPGMSMDGDGIIDGTPEAPGSFGFTVTATDAFEQTGEQAYTLIVQAPVIALTPTEVPDATVGVDYEILFSASGGNGPYSFTVTGGTLPPGLFLFGDGTLGGTPTDAGDFAFTVTATDAFDQAGEQVYSVTVQNALIVLSPSALPEATVGIAYEQPIVASGGTGSIGYSVTAGTLPPGMGMDGDGIIDGTPTEAGSFGFTVTATDSFNQTGEQAYTLAVQGASITLVPASLPGGVVGDAYHQAISASGGTGPYTFAVTTGTLPPGLFLASDGTLDGTPSEPGNYGFTLTATDNFDQTGARAYTLEVADVTIVLAPAALPNGSVGTAYHQAIAASGGTAPYSFAVTAGSLPPGMGMDGDGVIDGTPEQAGTFAFTVAATDAFEQVGEHAYSLEVLAPVITVDPANLPGGTVGVDYAQLVTASGGTAPYTFAVTAGTLPAGLFLSSDGTLEGAPEEAGSFGFTVTATDNYNQAGAQAYTLEVAGAAITLTPVTLPHGSVGTAYEVPISASGGSAPYSFEVTAGTLPPGMGMDGDGIVDGTPEQSGSFAFTVVATDAFGQVGEHAYTLEVLAPVITLDPATLPAGTVGVDYAQLFTASGGNAPYTFEVTAGTLPAGLFLSSDGTLDGAPAEAGSFGFTVTATDNYNQAGAQAYTLEVAGAAIVLTPVTLPPGSVGTAYEVPISASGGIAPYSFEITAGTLPPGMGMDGDGIVDGTPEQAGSFAITVKATDAFGQVGERAYALQILSPVITLDPASLPAGAVGVDYAQPITASGGNAPYTFALTAGTLPGGLFLSSDGTLDGTPEEAGSFGFTITATDNYNQAGAQAYTLAVEGATILVSPSGALPGAVAGAAYHQSLDASGGTAPYAFEIVSGELPPGISLASDGVVSGTPTAPGTFAFVVGATDAFGQEGEGHLEISVEAAEIIIAPATLPAPTVGAPYRLEFEATGGVAPYAFALGGGTLPPGLSLGSDGVLDGTPTAGGDFLFAVTATDAIGNQGEQEYLLALVALPDPTEDPDVIGLVTSQVSTVRLFATTQIANVHHHLETLHGGGDTGWSFWIAGSVRSGDRDGTGEVSPLSFETSGLTGGSDYRLNQQLAFGGGLGYARDRSAIGDDGSRNEGDAPSGVSYMSWHPEEMPFFLDGMGGYQDLEFDVRRITEGGATFLSRRMGKQRFTSWQGGYEHSTDTFLFSPYGRVDAASARLDGFRELGDDPLALRFGSQDVDLRTTTIGFRMHYRMETGWGEWEPRVRLEYQRDFHEDDGVSIRYANQATSPVFFTTPLGLDEDRIVLELGSIFRTNWYGLLIRVDYLGVYGGANDNEHGLTFSFQED